MFEKQETQQELFEEFSQPGSLRRRVLPPSAGKRLHYIAFSNEQFIFAVIGFIIVLVIGFSLGVERGKRITPIKQSQPAEAPAVPEEDVAKVSYAVQLAAYKDARQAEQEKRLLEKKGYNPELVKSGIYSVVYITGFSNREEAETAVKNLKDKYKDCFVKRKK